MLTVRIELDGASQLVGVWVGADEAGIAASHMIRRTRLVTAEEMQHVCESIAAEMDAREVLRESELFSHGERAMTDDAIMNRKRDAAWSIMASWTAADWWNVVDVVDGAVAVRSGPSRLKGERHYASVLRVD